MSFAEAIAEPGQPAAAFAALARLADAAVGARLFTLMTFDPDTREARRIYTNAPEAYPTGGTKPVNPTRWTAHVLDERRVFVANTAEEVAEVFFDHELIAALGCAAALNLPIVVADRVVGTINCLDRAGTYTAERVAAAEGLRLPGAAAFLLYETSNPGTGGGTK
jgi:GAF domain-containing protein